MLPERREAGVCLWEADTAAGAAGGEEMSKSSLWIESLQEVAVPAPSAVWEHWIFRDKLGLGEWRMR